MYKVVIDANLWISFVIGKKLKLKILKDLSLSESISIISCPKIVEEFLNVSSREKIRKYADEKKILDVFDLIKSHCVDNPAVDIEVPELRDPKDLYLLALAKVSNADFLLTGDKDLLILERHEQTRIISFSGFMARLEMLENKNSP